LPVPSAGGAARGAASQNTPSGDQIADREFLEKIQAIDRLPETEKDTVKAVLDSFVLNEQFQRLARAQKAGPVNG
jgi:hypothetical protein